KSVVNATGILRAALEGRSDLNRLAAFNQNDVAELRATFGNERPLLAESLMNLAQALEAQGKKVEAAEASRGALRVNLKLKGSILANLPALVRQQARAMDASGKTLEAQNLFEESIRVATQKLGETNLILGELLFDYGNLLDDKKKIPQAAEYHLKSLPI